MFYDVKEATVEILAIVPKVKAEAWLAQAREPETAEEESDETSGTV